MAAASTRRGRYGTWIRSRALFTQLLAGVGALALTAAMITVSPWYAWLALLAVPPLVVVAILARVRWLFDDEGGGYQARIHDLIVQELRASATVLDIGCGSGRLVVALARQAPQSQVTGVDAWGEEWEYSVAQCEQNAAAEGVSARFVQGSASQLPFATSSFDAVVSCLTFHEVLDTDDRTECLVEALRVLKPGGAFVFLDLFDRPEDFGGRDRVLQALGRAGGEVGVADRLVDRLNLPFPLTGRRSLRDAVLLCGTKGVAR